MALSDTLKEYGPKHVTYRLKQVYKCFPYNKAYTLEHIYYFGKNTQENIMFIQPEF